MTFNVEDGAARALARDAMRRADESFHMISAHERVCVERYDSINDKLDGLTEAGNQRRESIRGIYGMLWVVAGTLVLILLAIVGYLLDRQFPV
jgi:hypothetical protein